MSALLGRKIGMTSVYTEAGEAVPCTVIEAGPCEVVQIKTPEKDGYAAIQLGFEDAEEKKLNKPKLGHYAKANIAPKKYLKEFRNIVEDLSLGDKLTVTAFSKGDKIKVIGTSKGKGFQGVVKRHHFGGVGSPTHGQSDRERAPGSIGSSSYPSRVFKGLRMAGRMGGKKTSVRNLEILQVIPESNLLLVKGSVPGAPNSLVEIVKL